MTAEFVTYLLDCLKPLAPLGTRRMFGGTGLFHGGRMFALVDDDAIFVKVDEETRPVFEAAGLVPLTYETSRGGQPKTVALSYYTLPDGATADPDMLLHWVRLGIEAAARAPKAPVRRRSPSDRAANRGGRAYRIAE